ncbi:hypothetical protein BB558_000378 [Smittium angustum]|uniref:tRNA (guanine(37)-N1)-methyltransferase n=1 Tax=Smittium angustum TaxID=133377 RepID=A0A2U1JEF3_SMIAN|nr:hypothetical protein BB558_000378 [Smittium angustum]
MFANLIPTSCRGIKTIDRELFKVKIDVRAIKVPVKHIGSIQKQYRDELFNIPRQKNVIEIDGEKEYKLVLLRPDCENTENSSNEVCKLAEKEKWAFENHELVLNYEHWSAEDVLKAILPNPDEAPTSYEQIGHIAHMNLRDEYLPYKNIIGEVILDKSPTIKTVVNKLDTIDSTYRNFKMEVLAGEPNLVAIVRESGCRFKFDFSKVYWNSRLQNEHERIISLFKKKEYICDVMAGVGPFSIPAARNKQCTVWANDLNPSSYSSLVENIKLNKISNLVTPFNIDGREFIKMAFAKLALEKKQVVDGIPKTFDHVVMNLPATAIEFLDAFSGVLSEYSQESININEINPNMPTIHVHCFTKSETPETDILTRASNALGLHENEFPEFEKSAKAVYVRKVAPNKDMYCLSFPLPLCIAIRKQHSE